MFYKLLCSRDTLHRFNRCLLLFILALSAVVPFMYIDLGITATRLLWRLASWALRLRRSLWK